MDNFNINFGSSALLTPIQLISFTENKDIFIHEDALKFFSGLTDVNFATISVVGKYRTGKSYLLNRVLLDRSDGFCVGPTINPCTKGLWIWPSLIEVTNNNQKTKILVIDTEGIGAFNEEENHDIKIFLIAMLLSSYFVYNSVGNIDEMAIQNLSLIINLGKHLQKTNEKEFDDLVSAFPNFLWVVRDFALKLLDPFGNPITSKEYLENALRAQKGMTEAVENKNRIRRLITSFFRERDCAMLVRPLQNESELQNLSKIPLKDLRPEFVTQVTNLRRKIFAKIKPKSFKGKLVNGSTFIQLCKMFCHSINKGEIPSIQNSWNSVCKLECQRLVYNIVESYTNQMNEIMTKPPIKFTELNQKHKELKKGSLLNFGKNSFGDEKQFYSEELEKAIKSKFKEYTQSNSEAFSVAIKDYFDNHLFNITEDLEDKKINSLSEIQARMHSLEAELEAHFSLSEQSLTSVNSIFIDGIFSIAQKFLERDETEFRTQDRMHEGRLKSLEDKIESLQKEREADAKLLSDKIIELESQKSNALFQLKKQLEKKEKFCEESSKENEQLRKELEELRKQQNIHLEEQEKLKKGKEEKENSIQTINIEFSKKLALIQQKNQFLEAESLSQKEKISDLEEIVKILKENLENLSNENLELEEKALESNKEQYEMLSKDYSILETKHKELQKEKERLVNSWKMEKEYLNKELSLAKSQLDENKRNNDLILKTLSTSRKINNEHSSEHSGAILKANKNLSMALEKSEARCSELEKKVQKLSGWQKVIKHCSSIECKICLKWFTFELFQIHLPSCQKNAMEDLQAITFEVKYESSEENKFKKEFDIEVNYQKKSWSLKKTFKTLRHWANELAKSFPQIRNKPFFLSFTTKIKASSTKKSNKQEIFESKRLQIAKFLSEICKFNEIRNSQAFETFLAIDIHTRKILKSEACESSESSNSSFELDRFQKLPENLHLSTRLDRTLLSNKENMDYKELSDKKAKKKAYNDSRTSLKNISFKELFNDVNNKLSTSSKNNFGVMPFANKTNVISSNKHLLNMKTPRPTAFYSATHHEAERITEKTVIKSPLNVRDNE